MRPMFIVGLCFLSVALFNSIAARAVRGADTGSIKGEVSASGVRSPEGVVVFIEKVPSEQKPPADPVDMDQKKLVFVPHVLPIVKGTTVKFENGDPLLHNVFWNASDDGSYTATESWHLGTRRYESLHLRQSRSTSGLLCNIHPEMEGYILVLQNPYFAVVGKDGTYEIKNVPPGNTP